MGKSSGEIEGGIRAALRCCSLEARGLWTEMRYLIDESDANGFLRQAGRPMTPLQLARVAGCDAVVVAPLLRELEEAGLVTQRDRAWYSPHLERLSIVRASGARRVREFKERNAVKGKRRPRVLANTVGNTQGNAKVTPDSPIPSPVSPPTTPSSIPTPSPSSDPSDRSVADGGSAGAAGGQPRKRASGPHAGLIDHFTTAWAAKYTPRKYPFQGGKDGEAAKQILIACEGSESDAIAAVDRFLADDAGIFTGHRLTLLAGMITRFMVDVPASPAKGHANGHHHKPSAEQGKFPEPVRTLPEFGKAG